MVIERSPYVDLVREVLAALSRVRRESNAWLDSESEEMARETQVFKIGECLRPFYMASRDHSELAALLPLDILKKDTQFFLKTVEKQGYFPSPYSPISGAKDQYTDFAAFSLEMATLIYDFWQQQPSINKNIVSAASGMAEKALAFLLEPRHRLEDNSGVRWGGTSEFSRVKKVHEDYADSYFTANILISIVRVVDHPAVNLSETKKEEVRGLVLKGCRWLVGRFDGQFITGDEAKANRSLLHTTWALHALAEAYDILDSRLKREVPVIVEAYLANLRLRFTRKDSALQQEYLTILSKEVDPPLYYEDRSGVGGVLLTLAILRSVSELERLLEESSYAPLLESVFNSAIALRSPTTGLWYGQGLILSLHSYLVEAFLVLSRRGTEFGRKLEVSGPMVREAVRASLANEAILAMFQQAVYQHLANSVDLREQGNLINEELSKQSSPGAPRRRTTRK